jgi:hypothetical protein
MNQVDHHRLRVFVLIDALGWSYLQGRKFLENELPYRVPLRTVLGFSSGAIPTILTGVPPAQNGHWNLFYLDAEHSPFRWLRHFGFLPDAVLNHRITTKLLKELGRRVLGLGPGFECYVAPRFLPWFNFVEKRNIYQRGGITGAPSIFDDLARADVPYRAYSYHTLTDEQILLRASEDLKSGAARFFFLYLSEMDAFLHLHCNEPEQVDRRLAWYGARLSELFELARKIDPDASLTVLSDHGMTPVRNHHDLVADVNRLGFGMPADYLAVYDSTMARFWFFNAEARSRIGQLLDGLSFGRILPDNELRALGILFPDRRYGELIFLLDPGWLIAESNFNGHGWMPLGMHGYHPDDSYSSGVFLSDRAPREAPQTNRDVYRCMREAC